MRVWRPRLRVWHLVGLVAASAGFLAVFQYRAGVYDPGVRYARQLRYARTAEERSEAMMKMVEVWDDEHRLAGPVFIALNDQEPSVRADAAWVLGLFEPNGSYAERARSTLIAMMDAEPTRVQVAMAASLSRLGAEAEAALPTLLLGATDPDPEIRGEAVEGLFPYVVKDEAAFQAARDALDDPDMTVRWKALNSLGAAMWMGSPPRTMIEPLEASFRRALADPDPMVRQHAATQYGFLAATGGIGPDPLLDVLGDPEVWVRRNAASSLGRLGIEAQDALPRLESLAEGDSDGLVRWYASGAVESIRAAVDRFHSEELPGAIADLEASDPSKRLQAALFLTRHTRRSSPAVPSLIARLEDPNPDVRREVAGALGRIGLDAAPALPGLDRLAAGERDVPARRAAAIASARIRAAVAEAFTAWRPRT